MPDSGAVVVSLGMSTTSQIWQTWASRVRNEGLSDAEMYLPATACGTCTSDRWDDYPDKGWNHMDDRLARRGYTFADVDVVWMMLVLSQTESMEVADLDRVLTQVRTLLPNARQVWVTTYPYGGNRQAETAEPEFWRSGTVVREWILSHLTETDPWIGWAPYLWAYGDTPRSDGLVWLRSDYVDDGIHLSVDGRNKATDLLHPFFATCDLTAWYRP